MFKSPSFLAWLLCSAFLAGVSFGYYPKWNKDRTEATISWDVSGYYWYLPAAFIYRDARNLDFSYALIEKYYPAPGFDQAFAHPSGARVLKYSSGMALMYLPAFLAAHALAPLLGYEADGFSRPYQFGIQLWSLLWAILSLWGLRRLLLAYYGERTVAAVLALLVLASNYLNYAAIDAAMPHQWLFGWYVWLMVFTRRFYLRPTIRHAALIGLCIGVMALARPTELISALIPVLWGLSGLGRTALAGRLRFFRSHARCLLVAGAVVTGIGAIQLGYWKYVSGDWIVYSYQDQGFSWLRPHLLDYAFSYRSGWLIYTPLMSLALVGIYFFWKKKHEARIALTAYAIVAIYVVSAWDIWWYGGRAMIQSYPALAFPLAALLERAAAVRLWRYVLGGLLLLFAYYNLWYTHQLHRGGLVFAFDMTRAYFWKVLGRYTIPVETLRYLDTNDVLRGERRDVRLAYANDFESDTSLANPNIAPIEGRFSEYIGGEKHFTQACTFALSPDDGNWLRVSALVHTPQKEWDVWQMAVLVARFTHKGESVRERAIRIHRLVGDGETREVWFDIKAPRQPFDSASVFVWNGSGSKTVVVDRVRVEAFRAGR